MKKNCYKLTASILALALMFGVMMSSAQIQAKKSISLNKKTVTLTVGKTLRLRVKNTKKKVKWISSKKKIATVSSKGVVKARKMGKAKIYAKVGKKKLTCKVNIIKKADATNKNTIVLNTQPPMETVGPTASPVPNEMADIPQFISFKSYDGKNFDVIKTMNTFSGKKEATDKADNKINKDEMLLVKLSYENKKRDSIVEIVLDDSDYGNKQIYTTAASVNKIESSDTYYDIERDTYVTDVLLKMPKTKSTSSRQITIDETCFLRETVGLKGYADMQHATQTTMNFEVSETPRPSYSVYFNFVKSGESYTVLSLSTKYDLPDTLYIPTTYEGLPVTKLSDVAFDKAPIKKLLVPASVRTLGSNLFGCAAPQLSEIQMLNEDAIPGLGTLGLSNGQLRGQCRIIVPRCMAWYYLKKQDTTSGWSDYVSLMYYQETDGTYAKVTNATEDMCKPADKNDEKVEFTMDLSSDLIKVTTNMDVEPPTGCAITRDNGKIQMRYSRMNMLDFEDYLSANQIVLEDYNKLTMTITAYDKDGQAVTLENPFEKFALVTRECLDGYDNSNISTHNYFEMPEVVMDLSEVDQGAAGMNIQFNHILTEYPQIAYVEISSITLS